MYDDIILQSPIVEVNFAGFTSDTYRLSKNGWSFSMQMDPMGFDVRLALRHDQARLYGLTDKIPKQDLMGHCFVPGSKYIPRGSAPKPVYFNVICMANDIELHIMPMTSFRGFPSSFSPVDMEPEYTKMERLRFSDFVPFKTINPDAPEIYVDQKTIPELMELILKKQDPKQKEIRENMRREAWRDQKRQYNPAKDIQAQIISLAI